MPTAPAGVGESEPRQLPERGMGERETAKREEYIGLKKEPKSETLYGWGELEGHRRKVEASTWWWGNSGWLCWCWKRTGMQLTDHTTNDGNSRTKQTNSDEQGLINSVVQLQTWSIKGRASLTCRQKCRHQCNERWEGPVSMSKKTDVWSPDYGDPSVPTPFPSLPTTHTLHPHMYLWNVLGEAPVCFDCKHLNAGERWAEPGQVGWDRSKVTGLMPVPRFIKTRKKTALCSKRLCIAGACGVDSLNSQFGQQEQEHNPSLTVLYRTSG